MKTSNFVESRRNFLRTVIPAGGMICFGCQNLYSANIGPQEVQAEVFTKRIQSKISFSHEQYFKNRYNFYINYMGKIANYLGREKLISMLMRANDELNLTVKPNLKAKSVKDFIIPILEDENYKIRLDLKVLELTDNVYEHRVTNCLWAKTFLAKNAGDIGYASICHGDISGATAFNPKLKLERTKTLMEGHDCCDHKYIWEG